VVLKFLSVSNIVIAPANTGNDKSNKKAVINTDQTNRGNLSSVNPGALILNIVVIKFIVPIIDEAPAQCKLKMAISTDPPECVCGPDKGG